jgi:hypothetical protein
MDEFNWEDFENEQDDEFGKRNEIEKGLNKLQRLLFIHDLEKHRTQIVSIDPTEFIDLFGEPTEEDLEIMTQILIDDVHRLTNVKVIDKWGLDWIKYILDFNVEVEEYELCAVFKELIDDSKLL